MLCCICKERNATVHYTKIDGDKVQKVDLCEECSKTKGVNDPVGFELADLTTLARLGLEMLAEVGGDGDVLGVVFDKDFAERADVAVAGDAALLEPVLERRRDAVEFFADFIGPGVK